MGWPAKSGRGRLDGRWRRFWAWVATTPSGCQGWVRQRSLQGDPGEALQGRAAAGVEHRHPKAGEVVGQGLEACLPIVVELAGVERGRVLAEPVRPTVGGSAAIQAQQHHSTGTPQVREVDGLIAAVAAEVDQAVRAEARLVRRPDVVDTEAARGFTALRPELTLEVGAADGFDVVVPPAIVCRVEGVGPGAEAIGVVGDDAAPAAAGNKLTVFGREAWAAGNDTDDFASPASVTALDLFGGEAGRVKSTSRVTALISSNCSTSPSGS